MHQPEFSQQREARGQGLSHSEVKQTDRCLCVRGCLLLLSYSCLVIVDNLMVLMVCKKILPGLVSIAHSLRLSFDL